VINLVVALASEARPLVRHFRLSQDREARGFRIYCSDRVRLVVTGVGKMNAAAGVAFLGGRDCSPVQVWLNVGLAGHRNLAVGTGITAVRITDHTMLRNWYPPRVAFLSGSAAQVTTFDSPVEHYPEGTACDMEASAFFPYATRFSTAELVQCFKVISDNESTGVAVVQVPMAEELIAARLGDVDQVCCVLEEIAAQLPGDDDIVQYFEQYHARWHFTASQQAQLREALRRLAARGPADNLSVGRWLHCTSTKILLKEMREFTDALPVVL
jgi:nucleoside phosphorylase